MSKIVYQFKYYITQYQHRVRQHNSHINVNIFSLFICYFNGVIRCVKSATPTAFVTVASAQDRVDPIPAPLLPGTNDSAQPELELLETLMITNVLPYYGARHLTLVIVSCFPDGGVLGVTAQL